MFRALRSTVLALSLALAAPLVALAHPGHEHKVMGTISAVDGKHITVKTADGKDVGFEITDVTKFVRSKGKGTVSDLRAGLRIVASMAEGAEPLKATQVQYTAAATK